ncbi:MAG: hypothetical protein ONB46_17045 [candidate division KSB1 bacterium]|nr:hypothetical protein [candidate division KSB1 bacterium]MDZ7367459.1 hypothetical protein [candidate division KSB1 bacterium]MDZ7405436.1 hypothetical protein [candidate division KSB1 bacterium]
MQTVTISLPEKTYHRLQHASEIAGKPIHEFAAQSVAENLPPLLDMIPVRYRDDLRRMEKLSDDELWAIARSRVDEKSQRRHQRLLKKNSAGTLTQDERKALTELRLSADGVMLRKAYAFLLLKLRGYRLPSLQELESVA